MSEKPIIKEPVWKPEIPFYFYTGGLAGASAGLAWLAERRGNGPLARRAWTAALGGVVASPALLISDLGKPSRFFNMLRMVRVTSPMSLGSWLLTGSGGVTAVAAANAWTGAFPRAARAAKPAAAALGLPLATYTAALVSNTAVPVWHEARTTLPPVFAASAAASAGAAAAALTPPRHAGPARRLAVGGAVAELAATQAMERQLGKLGEPYKQGPAGILTRLAKLCLAAGAALMGLRAADSRGAARAGGALITAGAILGRWGVFRAGFQSAADPSYTAGPQRRRIQAGEGRGAIRRGEGRVVQSGKRGSPATTL